MNSDFAIVIGAAVVVLLAYLADRWAAWKEKKSIKF